METRQSVTDTMARASKFRGKRKVFLKPSETKRWQESWRINAIDVFCWTESYFDGLLFDFTMSMKRRW